VQRS